VRPPQLGQRELGSLASRLKGAGQKRETEDTQATGDVLMAFGAYLTQGSSGTGCDRETRIMGDYSSRLYVLEEASGPKQGLK